MQFIPPAMPFYVNAETEVVVDPLARPPTVQNVLLQELKKCEELVQRDYRYAHLVAGASKMAMAMIWAVRNQDELVNDADLAMFKDLAWNEFVKKRYLPTLSESSVCASATSMLEIVRDMNLQRRRFQIMGLHEQVEASEIQLVLHLCQAGIIRCEDYRKTANRFRRSDRLHEAFALAVGATVCATAPLTLGAATARYERDLQYEYRKNAIALFVYVLQKHPGPVEAGLDEDYVSRIARLIVVSPSSCRRLPGAAASGGGNDNDDDDKYGRLSNAIAIAQHLAEDAGKASKDVGYKVEKYHEGYESKLQAGLANVKAVMTRLETEMEHHEDRTQCGLHQADTRHQSDVNDLKTKMHTLHSEIHASMAEQQSRVYDETARMRNDFAGFQATIAGLFQGKGADGADPHLAAAIAGVVANVKAQCIAELTSTLQATNQQIGAIAQHISGLTDRVTTLETAPAQHAAPAALGHDRRVQEQLDGLAQAIQDIQQAVRDMNISNGSTDPNIRPDVGRQLAELRGSVGTICEALTGERDFTLAAPILKGVITALDNIAADLDKVIDGLRAADADGVKPIWDNLCTRLDVVNDTQDTIRKEFERLENKVKAINTAQGLRKTATFKPGADGKLPRPGSARPARPSDAAASPDSSMASDIVADAQDRAKAILDDATARADTLLNDATHRTDEINQEMARKVELATAQITRAEEQSKDLITGAIRTIDTEIARLAAYHAAHPTQPPGAPADLVQRMAALERLVHEQLGPADYSAFDGTPAAAMTYALPGGDHMGA